MDWEYLTFCFWWLEWNSGRWKYLCRSKSPQRFPSWCWAKRDLSQILKSQWTCVWEGFAGRSLWENPKTLWSVLWRCCALIPAQGFGSNPLFYQASSQLGPASNSKAELSHWYRRMPLPSLFATFEVAWDLHFWAFLWQRCSWIDVLFWTSLWYSMSF